jgi:hypothetical protein
MAQSRRKPLCLMLAVAAVFGGYRAAFAQTFPSGATGGVPTASPGGTGDVRQDPNSALDFEAVRGTGTGNVGQNFRGTLGASTPSQGRDIGQGLPSSSVGGSAMPVRPSMPDLRPNLSQKRVAGEGAEALKSMASGLILPRYQRATTPSDRRRYFAGRWWYWRTDHRWSYWDGSRWSL